MVQAKGRVVTARAIPAFEQIGCSNPGPLGCPAPIFGSVPPSPGQIHRAYWDFHNAANVCPRFDDMAHPELSGVIVAMPWSVVEPQRGVFDFCRLEEHIRLWDQAGKKVIIRNLVSGESELPNDVSGTAWPNWMCCAKGQTDGCIPCLSFCDNALSTSPTYFPVTWSSPDFLEIYGEYVQALANEYDGDSRVDYVWIGVGHLGFLTASPSRGGDCAIRDAGWTPEIWEAYIKNVIDIYSTQFESTPLLLAVTPLWARSFSGDTDPVEFEAAVVRVVDYAVDRGASILLNGLNECNALYESTPFTEVLAHLAQRSLPADFTLIMGDDFPLYSEDRPEEAFRCLLQTARLDWHNAFEGVAPLAAKLQRNEVRASNPVDPTDFVPSVGAILNQFIADEPTVSVSDSNNDGVPDVCDAFACVPSVGGACIDEPTQCFSVPVLSPAGMIGSAVLTMLAASRITRRRTTSGL